MSLKSVAEKVLFKTPQFHCWILLHRKQIDSNKLTFISLIKEGQIVVDVGANFGFYTRLFSNIVGPKGRVIAFEPVQATISRFLKITRFRENIDLVRKGLGANELRTKIYIPDADLGQSSLIQHESGSWRSPQNVRQEEIVVTTLDMFVAENAIQRIDFIKVDIEGAEAAFLAGAEITLKRFKPLVYIEINHLWLKDFGESPHTILERLSQLGYRFIYEAVVVDRSFQLVSTKISDQTNGDFLFAALPLREQ